MPVVKFIAVGNVRGKISISGVVSFGFSDEERKKFASKLLFRARDDERGNSAI